jgi:hypothetical protein
MSDDGGVTMEEVLARRFPLLPGHLASALERVAPSEDWPMLYYPCAATLKDGSVRDFVYLAEARLWLPTWGAGFHRHDNGRLIDVRDIADFRESDNRLPPKFANELYMYGVTGMGYVLFGVRFDDGSNVAYLAGNAVDFIHYPSGKSARNVMGVVPHQRSDQQDRQSAPSYYWSVFERP